MKISVYDIWWCIGIILAAVLYALGNAVVLGVGNPADILAIKREFIKVLPIVGITFIIRGVLGMFWYGKEVRKQGQVSKSKKEPKYLGRTY